MKCLSRAFIGVASQHFIDQMWVLVELAIHSKHIVNSRQNQGGLLTHLILGEDSSGKKKEVAIPVSAIKSFGQERIYLNIDKRATSSLPKVPIERRYELALKTEIEKYAERESDLASRVADLESELQEMRAELLATIDDRFETLSEEIDALKQKSL